MLTALRGMDVVAIDQRTAGLVAHGRVLPAFDGPGPWAVVDGDGVLLAVYERFGAREAKPSVVLQAGAEG